ncbi:MAG: four helix bundle protein [Patescibacteria group bacterium]
MMEGHMKIKNFHDLNVWKQAHTLVLEIYGLTKNFPREELYSLSDQLKRAAVSITSNIAEGFGRRSYAEKIYFYSIAQGSLTELQNQLIVARDVNYLSKDSYNKIDDLSVNVNKLLNGLLRKTRQLKTLNSSF